MTPLNVPHIWYALFFLISKQQRRQSVPKRRQSLPFKNFAATMRRLQKTPREKRSVEISVVNPLPACQVLQFHASGKHCRTKSRACLAAIVQAYRFAAMLGHSYAQPPGWLMLRHYIIGHYCALPKCVIMGRHFARPAYRITRPYFCRFR